MNTGYSQDTFLQRPLTIVDEVLEQNVKQYGFNHDAIKNTQATVRQIFQQQFEHQLQQVSGIVTANHHILNPIRFLF